MTYLLTLTPMLKLVLTTMLKCGGAKADAPATTKIPADTHIPLRVEITIK